MTNVYFADVSKYQAEADASYPYPILAFRADSGYETDAHAVANWNFCKSSPKIQVAIAYLVFIPGQNAAVMQRVKTLFGQTCPPKLVLEVDMESGAGFAGPGDHSAEANALVDLADAYTGSPKRELEYGNKYDQASDWAKAPTWLKRITAAYSSTDPKTFGWQYSGGTGNNPVPAGYPVRCPPFGTAVDMNVIHLPIGDIVIALGLAPEDELTPADLAAIKALLAPLQADIEAVRSAFTEPNAKGVRVGVSLDTIVAEATGRHTDPIVTALASVASDVSAIKAATAK